MTRNVLFIGGSLNQTTMMHKVAQRLDGCNAYFSPFFADGFLSLLAKAGLLDFTILGGRHRQETLRYLRQNRLPLDEGGKDRPYDLVVTATDLITPKIVRRTPTILVQEGIMEPEDWTFQLVKHLRLPRYLANTAATGLSDQYEVFCVASEGYRDLFIRKGVKPHKLVVTGLPNLDDLETFRQNDFPFRGYVLVATSSARETFKRDARIPFLREVRRIAAGRPILVKLHPNENRKRAIREIQRFLPEAQVLTEGNIYPMIANCEVLIPQYSTVTFAGLLLGKETHSYVNLEELKELLPIQNGSKSAERIAAICQDLLSRPRLERERRHDWPGNLGRSGRFPGTRCSSRQPDNDNVTASPERTSSPSTPALLPMRSVDSAQALLRATRAPCRGPSAADMATWPQRCLRAGPSRLPTAGDHQHDADRAIGHLAPSKVQPAWYPYVSNHATNRRRAPAATTLIPSSPAQLASVSAGRRTRFIKSDRHDLRKYPHQPLRDGCTPYRSPATAEATDALKTRTNASTVTRSQSPSAKDLPSVSGARKATKP